MSVNTYELRDIVVIMNDALDSFKKSGDSWTKTIETASSFAEFQTGAKEALSHYHRGMFRLGLAYEKLAKGAKLEEEKEEAKKKSEMH